MLNNVFLLFIFTLITSCASASILEIKGMLYMKGSNPHSYLIITDEKSNVSYRIENKDDFDLNKKQKVVIKVNALLVNNSIGPGFPARIKVLEVLP